MVGCDAVAVQVTDDVAWIGNVAACDGRADAPVGAIADVRLYSGALTAQMVRTHRPLEHAPTARMPSLTAR